MVIAQIRIFFLLLGCKAALLFWFLLSGFLPLGPDEAQYWTWSERLAVGYYSKPPGIAYQIALGTSLFGASEWGVRSFSLLIGTLQSIMLYLLGKEYYKDKNKALMLALAWTVSPVGIIGSLLAITDVAMIFFLTVALFFYCKEGVSWKTALFIGLGALFKWPIYFFWAWVALDLLLNKKKILWFPILLSLLGIIPSLLWNLSHEGATFRHVFATLIGGSSGGASVRQGNLLEFFGAQIFLFSPLFFFLVFRNLHFRGFLARSFFLTFIGALIASLGMKLQGNWAIFLYPLGFLLLGEQLRERTLLWGAVISLLLIGLIPFLPYKSSPIKHNLGVDHIALALAEKGMTREEFIAAGSYQLAAQASFYNPFKTIAYFINLDGRRENQFSFWPSVAESGQKKGWFLSYEEGDGPALRHFFRTASDPTSFPLYGDTKRLYLYLVEDPIPLLPSHQKHY